ncbi:HAD family hydrolase [Microbacterium sp. ASV49]|uniref:HAD family hydrolase n=1 Tax=Microbacterium candidum TaxID=3041922 RepID=A0ABT7MVT9_9MICO|nr:HAD family hydrolase [Microbacterium sp. ASV49]MDL9978578.1 HAD family hydrolase [Microbacterium sp. ASV49]
MTLPTGVAASIPQKVTGLVALDVDGTVLLGDEKTFGPGTVDAIAHAVSAGNEVMLATGRSWAGTEWVMRELGIESEFVVCSNGAVVMRRNGDGYERFHTETFDPSEVLDLLVQNIPDAHYMVELPDGHRLYTEPLDHWNLADATQVPFAELSAQAVSRVVVVSPGQTDEDFMELVEHIGLHHVSYAIGWTAWLDIAPLGVDKSTGLELVRRELDVDGSRVVAVGDGRNDLGMFAWAREHGGRAVAMAQAPQEVKDAASEVTASVADGGAAAILRRL